MALDGIPEEDAEGDLMEDIVLDAVDGTIDSIPARRRRDPELLREAVRAICAGGCGPRMG